jgi:hypothetical protein
MLSNIETGLAFAKIWHQSVIFVTAKLKMSHGLTPLGHQMLLGHPNNSHWRYMDDMK